MADQKVTELTNLTAAASEDVFYIVDDPTGTPASKKITAKNLLALSLRTQPLRTLLRLTTR